MEGGAGVSGVTGPSEVLEGWENVNVAEATRQRIAGFLCKEA